MVDTGFQRFNQKSIEMLTLRILNIGSIQERTELLLLQCLGSE